MKRNFEALLAAKAFKEKKASGVIRFKVEGTDEVLEINRLPGAKIVEIVENAADKKFIEVCDELIYEAIPELREMLEEYECINNPVGIVEKFFTEADRVKISEKLREVTDSLSVEEIKN